MTTVAEIAKSRKHATLRVWQRDLKVLFEDDRNILFQGRNQRGRFEILLAEDTLHVARDLREANGPVTLEGFFRRRSTGFLADGTRHYIWTFCPTGILEEVNMAA